MIWIEKRKGKDVNVLSECMSHVQHQENHEHLMGFIYTCCSLCIWCCIWESFDVVLIFSSILWHDNFLIVCFYIYYSEIHNFMFWKGSTLFFVKIFAIRILTHKALYPLRIIVERFNSMFTMSIEWIRSTNIYKNLTIELPSNFFSSLHIRIPANLLA